MINHVSVVGCGKLGLCLAVCLSDTVDRVVCMDNNISTLKKIEKNISPFYEPGLTEKLHTSNLVVTESPDVASRADIIFIVVPTPSTSSGSFDYTIAEGACTALGRCISKDIATRPIFCLVSTVSPGSCQKIIESIEASSGCQFGKDFGFCYNPAFIALGSVIENFMHPDFVLLGGDPISLPILQEFYGRFLGEVKITSMSIESAEITKISLNAYVTLKISFANFLGQVCSKIKESNVDDITEALGYDSRIGPKYTKASLPFAGPCFPRDTKAFINFAELNDSDARITSACDDINDCHMDFVIRSVIDRTESGSSVGILGVSYKPNTSGLDESPSIKLAARLKSAGIGCCFYDPIVYNHGDLSEVDFPFVTDIRHMARCDVLVLMHPSGLVVDHLMSSSVKGPRILIDCWRTHNIDIEGIVVVSLFNGRGE